MARRSRYLRVQTARPLWGRPRPPPYQPEHEEQHYRADERDEDHSREPADRRRDAEGAEEPPADERADDTDDDVTDDSVACAAHRERCKNAGNQADDAPGEQIHTTLRVRGAKRGRNSRAELVAMSWGGVLNTRAGGVGRDEAVTPEGRQTDERHMNDIKRYRDTPADVPAQPQSDGWTITPRAITTIATILAILYSLHAPVRYVLGVGSSVESLAARVAALETIVAREQERAAATEARLEAITNHDKARSR